MACVTLKRSHDFNLPHSHVPNKRRRCFPRSTSSVPTPCSTESEKHSVFSLMSPPLTSDRIVSSLTDEVYRLQRRKFLMPRVNHSVETSESAESLVCSPTSLNQCSCKESIPASDSRSFSREVPTQCKVCSNSEIPLFTFRQVTLMCERLLKEREEKLRKEYDDILNSCLAEQYEAFLKFTQDQLHSTFTGNSSSYVS